MQTNLIQDSWKDLGPDKIETARNMYEALEEAEKYVFGHHISKKIRELKTVILELPKARQVDDLLFATRETVELLLVRIYSCRV